MKWQSALSTFPLEKFRFFIEPDSLAMAWHMVVQGDTACSANPGDLHGQLIAVAGDFFQHSKLGFATISGCLKSRDKNNRPKVSLKPEK